MDEQLLKDFKKNVVLFKVEYHTFVVVLATHVDYRQNDINRIGCQRLIPIFGYPVSRIVPAGGYVYDAVSDSYLINCVDCCLLGMVPFSLKMTIPDVGNWSVYVPLCEKIISDSISTSQNEDLNKFNKFCKDRREFSYKTFGTPAERDCIGPLIHLKEEVQELIDNPNDEMEWADCWLLLLDAAERKGYSVTDLIGFGRKKLEINKKRTWDRRSDGVFKHTNNESVSELFV